MTRDCYEGWSFDWKPSLLNEKIPPSSCEIYLEDAKGNRVGTCTNPPDPFDGTATQTTVCRWPEAVSEPAFNVVKRCRYPFNPPVSFTTLASYHCKP